MRIFQIVAGLAIIACVIYVLSAFAGTTGRESDIDDARSWLLLYFGLPAVALLFIVTLLRK